ncbi:hypothetical protein GF323_04270, partial [Candidatus Woesearchaeota archaeon]|nr:hypothetical protein [Candidatus Woesearchaeota archaeon]
MKLRKLSMILFLLLISTGFTSAVRYIEYDFRYGELFSGGYTKTDIPLASVNAAGYVCGDSECSFASSELWGGDIMNSGNKDEIVLAYPTHLQSQNGYGVFFYKPGYITWEQGGIKWSGMEPGEQNSPKFSNTVYITKAQMCRAQIDEFSVLNTDKPNIPVIMNVSASLDAATHAALGHAGPIDYVPDPLKGKYYSVNTSVELNIYDSAGHVVYNNITDVLIEFSGKERTSFKWVPNEADEYFAVVSSYVTDKKCLESEVMEATKEFNVLEEEPEGMCYTLLNNLTALPIFAQKGDKIGIDVEKLSNLAFKGNLYPLPTWLDLEIYNENFQLIHAETRLADANPDNTGFIKESFEWESTAEGMLTIIIYAIADDCPFKDNLEEIESINYHIYHVPECSDGADNDADGYIDYPDDFGCSSEDDDSEANDGDFQCNDGIDNDN